MAVFTTMDGSIHQCIWAPALKGGRTQPRSM
jgi:hypothetical protein